VPERVYILRAWLDLCHSRTSG